MREGWGLEDRLGGRDGGGLGAAMPSFWRKSWFRRMVSRRIRSYSEAAVAVGLGVGGGMEVACLERRKESMERCFSLEPGAMMGWGVRERRRGLRRGGKLEWAFRWSG